MIASTHPVRCAIYTRSAGQTCLDSSARQRSLCGAHIRRRSNYGWITLPERYHDQESDLRESRGPALRRLLEQVERRQVDRLVVDELSRVCRSAKDLDCLLLILDYGGCALVVAGHGIDGATLIGRQVLITISALALAIDKRRSPATQTALNDHLALEALTRLRALQGEEMCSRVYRTTGNADSEPAS